MEKHGPFKGAKPGARGGPGGARKRADGKPERAAFAGKPRGRPEGRHQGKSDEKPYAKPYGKPQGKSYDKSYDKPYGKPQGKPYDKPAGKPYRKPDDRPQATPSDTPRGKPPITVYPDLEKRRRIADAEKAVLSRVAVLAGDEVALGCNSAGWAEFRETLRARLGQMDAAKISLPDRIAAIWNKNGFKTGAGRQWTARLVDVARKVLAEVTPDAEPEPPPPLTSA